MRLLIPLLLALFFGPVARAQAALPGIVYTTTIVSDTNVTSLMSELPISTLGISPYTTAIGSPPTGLRFTTAGTYKVVAQFLVTGDVTTYWSFGIQLDLASPGTYSLPTVTTPLTFVAGILPNTYVATVTVDSLPVSVGDTIGFAASVRPQTAGASYTIPPKALHGLAGTVLMINQ